MSLAVVNVFIHRKIKIETSLSCYCKFISNDCFEVRYELLGSVIFTNDLHFYRQVNNKTTVSILDGVFVYTVGLVFLRGQTEYARNN